MVAPMLMMGGGGCQFKHFRRSNISPLATALAGCALKQMVPKPASYLLSSYVTSPSSPRSLFSTSSSSSSSSFSSSSSSSCSCSSPVSLNRLCYCRSSISHSTIPPGSQYSTSILPLNNQSQIAPRAHFTKQSQHHFHTSSIRKGGWNDEMTEDDAELHHQSTIAYSLSLTAIRFFTKVEYEEDDFIEGAPEAFLYLLNNLSVGNMKDIEDILTEQGSEACRELCDDCAGTDELAMVKKDIQFLNLTNIHHVKKAEDNPLTHDHLVIIAKFWCVDYKEYAKRDQKIKELDEKGMYDPYMMYPIQPKREFIVHFLMYLNDQQKQASDWLIDDITYIRIGPPVVDDYMKKKK